MINFVIMEGYVNKEIQLSKTSKGKPVINFTLHSELGKWKNYFDCVAWGELAVEMCSKIKEGDLIVIDAKAKTDFYSDQISFKDRKRTFLEVKEYRLLSSGGQTTLAPDKSTHE